MYAAYHRLWTVTSLRSHQMILAMCRIPVWPTSRQNLKIIWIFYLQKYNHTYSVSWYFLVAIQSSVVGEYPVPSSDGDGGVRLYHCDNHSSTSVSLLRNDMLTIQKMSSHIILKLLTTWSPLLPKIMWRIEMIIDGTLPEFQSAVLVHSCPQGSL